MFAGVGMTNLGVAVEVTAELTVKVAVGEGVNVAVEVETNGISMTPEALPHRS